MKIILLILLFTGSIIDAQARPIIADLSIHSVDIDHDFQGLDILLFGARNDVGRVILALRGQDESVSLRRKERKLGVWIEGDEVIYEDLPNFYALGGGENIQYVNNKHLLQDLEIGIDNLNYTDFSSIHEDNLGEFNKAIKERKSNENLYQNEYSNLTFWGETLFRTVLKFPKNISAGNYTAESYLIDNGQLQALHITPINVRKIGLEAEIYKFAKESSFLYGVLSIFLAFFFGWIIHLFFRKR